MNHCLEARGPYACFTRPDLHAERVSYPVITPSAARAIFEAVYWKPQMAWEITRIEVLRLGRQIGIRTNEVKRKAASAAPFYVEDHRIQRHSLILADVAYRLHAEIRFLGDERPGPKHTEMFHRRLEKGQVFHRPSFGCREYACEVSPPGQEAPVQVDRDLGVMLLDRVWTGESSSPTFFAARMVQGVIEVPPRLRGTERAA